MHTVSTIVRFCVLRVYVCQINLILFTTVTVTCNGHLKKEKLKALQYCNLENKATNMADDVSVCKLLWLSSKNMSAHINLHFL